MGCNAASAAPWELGSEGLCDGWYGIYTAKEQHTIGKTEDEDVGGEQAIRNAEFITNARDDVPWLLAEVKRLRAALEDITSRRMGCTVCERIERICRTALEDHP